MTTLITAGIEINTEQRSVTYQQALLPIKGLTFEMLLALVEADNDVVSLTTLSHRVWKGKVVSDDTIAQRISLLRKALPEHASSEIESVRSEGYRWLAKVEHANESRPIQRKMLWVSVCAAIVVIIALTLVWLSKRQPDSALMVLDPSGTPGHGIGADVFTRVKLARAKQYASALTPESNVIAVQMYRELLRDAPNNVTYKQGLAQTLLDGDLIFRANAAALAEANDISTELLQQNPQQPEFLWLRGRFYEANEMMQEALEHYELARVSAPSDEQIALSLAHLYTEKGDLFEALALSTQTPIRQQSRQLNQIARLLYLTGQMTQAHNWFMAAQQIAPDNAIANFALAKFLMVSDKPEHALEVLSDFHRNATGTAETYLLEFLLSLERGDHDKAKFALNKAESVDPNDFSVVAWREWYLQQQNSSRPTTAKSTTDRNTDWPSQMIANAVIAMAHGDDDAALLMLLRATRLGYLDYRFIQRVAAFERLHGTALFEEIIMMMRDTQTEERRRSESLEIPNWVSDQLTYEVVTTVKLSHQGAR
ncbi:winged helix-turn-helix domain-containing protein [Alteromonas oceanisediminis]|uniref:winged helix-turn-helix domain-containing protein n=1 Tax=Alteromonas oceanisediminis TaxID=2836180 RepID=UPI001BDAFF70|nr:winged helix-turn-helix domain-containing protein [Alteromonas oceanisediminis]MBT0587380.1 winged helix-turn-helix domain-containing protein [Alteromonas oceanisediminis]